jgi:hypothetical protein
VTAVLHFGKGGRVKAVWSDRLAQFYERAFGPDFAAARRRASIILTVEEGRFRGHFYADMSHLADLTGDDEHRCCLYPPRKLEEQCKQDEVAYVNRNFIGAASEAPETNQ